MRVTIASAVILIMAAVTPAAAMCGGSSQGGQAGMCGRSTAADDPFGEKSQMSKKPSGMGMMCPCCRNMASMGNMDGMKHDNDPHKGMDMPKQ
jgi:hypothetical protein